jgi:hypothetical protein
MARRLGSAGGVVLTQRASYTQFNTTLDLGSGTARFVNTVREARLSGQLAATGAFGGAHTPRVGYEASRIGVAYDAGTSASANDLFTLRQQPTALSLYVDDTWRAHPRLLARVGARVEAVPGADWAAISPRASVRWFATPDFALTLAGGQYTQWMHAVRNEDAPVRIFDFWVGSDRFISPSRATHLVLGGERWIGARAFVRVETWGKTFTNVPEPNDGDDPSARGDEFNRLRGHAYGVDVLLRRLDGGRLGGWVAYGYAVSVRSPDGARQPLGRQLPARGRLLAGAGPRHNLNVVGTWRMPREWVASARFGFGSGTPFTGHRGAAGAARLRRHAQTPGTRAPRARPGGAGRPAERRALPRVPPASTSAPRARFAAAPRPGRRRSRSSTPTTAATPSCTPSTTRRSRRRAGRCRSSRCCRAWG